MNFYYVYVLSSQAEKYWYTGYTNNLKRRVNEHNSGNTQSTRYRGPFTLIYYEACLNEDDARAREKYLKSGMGKRYLKNRMKNSQRDLRTSKKTYLKLPKVAKS